MKETSSHKELSHHNRIRLKCHKESGRTEREKLWGGGNNRRERARNQKMYPNALVKPPLNQITNQPMASTTRDVTVKGPQRSRSPQKYLST